MLFGFGYDPKAGKASTGTGTDDQAEEKMRKNWKNTLEFSSFSKLWHVTV
jgi:hypothetical protein